MDEAAKVVLAEAFDLAKTNNPDAYIEAILRIDGEEHMIVNTVDPVKPNKKTKETK